jgi:ribosomal protein S18 acetylase RimI-like enzyme
MGIHPTEPMLSSAISAQTLYLGTENGALCAAMIVNNDVPAGYADGAWQSVLEEREYLVLHLLAVSRDCRRRGLAGAMVRGALEAARRAGKRSLRLDAWDGNAPAHALYRSLGFSDAGRMHETYDDGSSLDFYLFEYLLGEETA